MLLEEVRCRRRCARSVKGRRFTRGGGDMVRGVRNHHVHVGLLLVPCRDHIVAKSEKKSLGWIDGLICVCVLEMALQTGEERDCLRTQGFIH